MTVVSLDEHRARKAPAWNPKTQRHSWLDIDEDGHHHKCAHCWVRYHHEKSGADWVKVWAHGKRKGQSAKSLGPCPGPDGRPALTAVPDPPVLEAVAADGGAVPPKRSAQPVCCRCNPPCGRPGRLYLGGVMCGEAATAIAQAHTGYLAGLRAATSGSGMGVPSWRSDVA